jgi:hypothetical protein
VFLVLLGDNRRALMTLDQAPYPFKIRAGVRTAHGGLAAIALDLILALKFMREGCRSIA